MESIDVTALASGMTASDMTAKVVQVDVSDDCRTIWVNADGVCRLRVSQVEEIWIPSKTGTAMRFETATLADTRRAAVREGGTE